MKLQKLHQAKRNKKKRSEMEVKAFIELEHLVREQPYAKKTLVSGHHH